jgi:L-seryl-tRNA(Ser) seleniumtransferase
MGPMEKAQLLRTLPAIDKILKSAAACGLKERWLGRLVDDEIRRVVADLRQRIQEGRRPPTKAEVSDAEVIAERAGARLESRLAPGVVHCINASGVVLHTGLGRAVLPSQAIEAIRREASAYTVVSVNVEDAQRKRRETSVARILCALTGAAAATLVNNNAAATLIGLNTLAAGREAIISRGQLVEIGGSFRMPDVFKAAGVTLREVGTTNRTHLKDYACALCPETALILRVHPSNYQVTGFSKSVPLEQLVALGREHGIPVMDDLGAGALVALPPEPEISESLETGSDLVTCSGDKLIGGPQAGILLGGTEIIDRVRRNPLFRALRVDKLTLAALEATLRLFLRPQGPEGDHPTLRMLKTPPAALEKQAKALAQLIKTNAPGFDATLHDDTSQVGSGSLPGEDLPTTLVGLVHADWSASKLARRLRLGRPPVFTRIVDDRVCLDPRTIQDGEDEQLLHALKEIDDIEDIA